MNTVLSVALLKNMVRFLLQVVMGSANYWITQDYEQDLDVFSQENYIISVAPQNAKQNPKINQI